MPKKNKTLCVDDLRHAEYYGMQPVFDELYHRSLEGENFTDLMDLILSRDNILLAYRNIKANGGSYTAGTDNKNISDIGCLPPETVAEKVRFIVTGSQHGYRPKPVRRKDIPKPNGKTRPLGIPCIWDRLVQQCIKQVIEPICEAKFSDNSYGFRPNRSVEHAVQKTYTMLQRMNLHYVIEFDIKGFFDNVNHSKLMRQIWAMGIHDKQLIFIIKRILKAPIRMPDGTTLIPDKGTPQGGIISPILANIYLDKLDKYIKEYTAKFDKGKKRKFSRESMDYKNARSRTVRRLKSVKDERQRTKLILELKAIEQGRAKYPNGEEMDADYRRMKYARYADDFLVGIIGSKQDALQIKEDIKNFLADKLALELSDEKTLVTHTERPAKFLGYEITVRKSNDQKRDKRGRLRRRTYGKRVCLNVSMETVRKKLFNLGVLELTNRNGKEIWKPKCKSGLIFNDDLEILDSYNREIVGFYNYYSIANNCAHALNNFSYIMEYSMYKTFAGKYKCRTREVNKKYRKNGRFTIKHMTKTGVKERYFYNGGFKRKKPTYKSECDTMPRTIYTAGRTSLVERLKARECELCEATDDLVMHHVRKLKNLQGKESWERHMIARKRKTIAVCRSCHKKIHDGKID